MDHPTTISSSWELALVTPTPLIIPWGCYVGGPQTTSWGCSLPPSSSSILSHILPLPTALPRPGGGGMMPTPLTTSWDPNSAITPLTMSLGVAVWYDGGHPPWYLPGVVV
ncbi:unnamed protein product [Linum trigynum]|uniref:Uncharacterized protein n=1 Tax=Linum trigynum TaxID=586398 RepID=A0AAV2DGJ9_9ROSI